VTPSYQNFSRQINLRRAQSLDGRDGRPSSCGVPLLRPILKWAGAKTKLVPAIQCLLPPNRSRLVEPFIGSGAVALNLDFADNLLADANPDVVSVYEALSKTPTRFVRDCRAMFAPKYNTASAFNELREEFNASRGRYRRACIFIYLNRHGYNGLCRYNRSGGFNVPFGRYDAPYFPEKEFASFRSLLARSTVKCADFRGIIAEAGEGDVVYCDPPYSPISETANFTSYATGGFFHQDQLDLVQSCRDAANRGAFVVLSNHDTVVTRSLYRQADRLVELQVSRVISCDSANRKKVAELLIVYEPSRAATPR
jgi:DNA adenine methylase